MESKIINDIIRHKDVYQLTGKNIPPYRITCSEHRELVNDIKKISHDKNIPPAMISYYLGVEIEVVMIIDPYL